MDFIPKIKWHWLRQKLTGRDYNLTGQDKLEIITALDKGYYIILTADKGALSSWGVKVLTWLMTGKWPQYSHALVNVESDEDQVFKFVEAINTGVKFSSFSEVFKCDSVCFLRPKRYTQAEFDATVGVVYAEIGKLYDKKFKYNDPEKRSCVEIARHRMSTLPDYAEKMRIFEFMIQTEKNLVPQMFRDCPDFEVVLEIKR